MKKRFIPLLALLLSLCIIVPVSIAQIMAADAVQINVTAKGGIVEIYGVKVDNGKSHSVSSAPDEETSIIVPIKATPDEGYVFGSWSVVNGTIDNEKNGNANLTVNVDTSTVTLTANFVKTVGIQAKSSNAGGTVTASAEKAIPGGAGVTLTATPKDGYRLDGWTVDVPEDMSTIRDMVYVLTKTGNTATITVDAMYPDFVETPEIPDLIVTAHFEKEDAGHFVSYDGDILQEPHFAVGSGFPMDAAKVTGWSNDPNKEILVEFTGREQGNKRNDHLMIHTNNAEKQKLISEDVSQITFDNGSTEEITAGALQGVQTTYDAEAYKIGFTVTDKHSNVKHGTILLKFSGRALVAAEHGTVQYGEKTYNDGDVITFEVGKEVTISAAAADGYRLKEWAIEGVTPTSTEGDSVTFTVPDKFFSIKPVFEDTQVTVGIQAKSSNVGGTVTASAEKAVPGGAGVTLTATPKDG